MNKILFIRFTLLFLLLGFIGSIHAGEPCCHIMICCRTCNSGITFYVNGQWNASHDYRDINQTRDIMQKIKDAGIRTVIIDMTNPSQWTYLWSTFSPSIQNIQTVCREKNMKYFIFLGALLTESTKKECNLPTDMDAFQFWNQQAGKIWNNWAQDTIYKRFGYGDNRPMILSFLPAVNYWNDYKNRPDSLKTYLSRFYIGTTQVNDPVSPGTTDGWGYRNYFSNLDGSIRFASSNGGVNPADPWYKVSADEFRNRVEWAKKAEKYSIYGSYDDVCDAIQFGIANTQNASKSYNKYPENDPYMYYNIVKQVVHTGYVPNFWHFNSSLENWTTVNQLAATVSNSLVNLTLKGNDPYMHSPDNLGVSATNYKYVLVRMKNKTPSVSAELFWITNTSLNYEGSKHVEFSIIPNDTMLRTYIIDLSTISNWTGIIKQIRLDPTTNVSSGEVQIDLIKFVGAFSSHPAEIPGVVEAEDFNLGGKENAYVDSDNINTGKKYRMFDDVDIQSNSSTPTDYFILNIVSGEWIEYLINVSKTAIYNIDFRIAAVSSGESLNIELDDLPAGDNVILPATGRPTIFGDGNTQIHLTQGLHILKISPQTSGFSLNRMTFSEYVNNGIHSDNNDGNSFLMYPNPVKNQLTIISEQVPIKQIQITDLQGRLMNAYTFGLSNSVSLELNGLDTGMYLIRIENEKGCIVKKFVKQ